ncbi:hypothetical protein [Ekhidna sp.]|uniref:hypothetical protein n=1 Tax=Ekhidna sp. TaxID=2608089 RepID=UPI003513C50F
MRATYHLIFFYLFIACNQNRGESFDNENLVLAQMGDLEKWQNLQSLYIKAIHEEQRLDFPYYSEIKRNLSPTKVWVHQWTDEFDNIRYFNDSTGWNLRNGVRSEMDSSMYAFLKNWDRHLFYRTIKNLASKEYQANDLNDSTYTIWDGDYFIAKIILSDKGLPYKYFTPTISGDTSLTVYTKWSETDGIVHPDVSMALDSSFVFTAEIWMPYFEDTTY